MARRGGCSATSSTAKSATRRDTSHRVPDALRHSSCRCAEPGPYQTPACVTAPALQRTAPQVLRAALRPGHRELGLVSTRAEPDAGAQELLRINRFAVDPGFVVQMRAGRSAGRANGADHLSDFDQIADPDAYLR